MHEWDVAQRIFGMSLEAFYEWRRHIQTGRGKYNDNIQYKLNQMELQGKGVVKKFQNIFTSIIFNKVEYNIFLHPNPNENYIRPRRQVLCHRLWKKSIKNHDHTFWSTICLFSCFSLALFLMANIDIDVADKSKKILSDVRICKNYFFSMWIGH